MKTPSCYPFLFLLLSSWVRTWALSAACSNTSHGLGPFSPIPSASHTLPVNHPNFIDVTGITDETLSVSQLGVCVSPQRFRAYADVHVHKYTLASPSPTLLSCLTIISSNQHTGKWKSGRHGGVCTCNWKSAELGGMPGYLSHHRIGINATLFVLILQRRGEIKLKSTPATFLHQLMALQQHSEI